MAAHSDRASMSLAGSRVAMYWHNGRSLGHTAESAKIARGLVEVVPEVSIAGVTGAYHGLDLFPTEVDMVKLPAFSNYDRASGWDLRSRQGLDAESLFRARSEMIDVFLRHYAPDVLIVNHLHSGAEGELTTALRRPATGRRILTLRGILFDEEKTYREYFSSEPAEWIAQRFDAIYVHTDPEVFRLEDLYDVPPFLSKLVRYTGYLADPPRVSREAARAMLGVPATTRLVVASMGGGQGALPIWLALVDALAAARPTFDKALCVTGPYLEKADAAVLASKCAPLPWLELRAYAPDLTAWMAASDLFVGAAGSNMLGEILASSSNAIVIPRQVREPEQRLHATRLESLGLVRVCNLPDVMSGRLDGVLIDGLEAPVERRGQVMVGGARRYPTLLAEPCLESDGP